MLTKNDLKGIEGLLKPIKKTLDSHTKDLKTIKDDLGETKETVSANNVSLNEVGKHHWGVQRRIRLGTKEN